MESSAVPGRRAHGSDERLQHAPDKGEGVPMGDQEVDEGQDAAGMEEQAHDDSQCVHAQLTPKDGHVFHFQNLPSNQEQDAHRCIPGQATHLSGIPPNLPYGFKAGFAHLEPRSQAEPAVQHPTPPPPFPGINKQPSAPQIHPTSSCRSLTLTPTQKRSYSARACNLMRSSSHSLLLASPPSSRTPSLSSAEALPSSDLLNAHCLLPPNSLSHICTPYLSPISIPSPSYATASPTDTSKSPLWD